MLVAKGSGPTAEGTRRRPGTGRSSLTQCWLCSRSLARTRGRLQPLFEDITVPQLVLLDAVQACGLRGHRCHLGVRAAEPTDGDPAGGRPGSRRATASHPGRGRSTPASARTSPSAVSSSCPAKRGLVSDRLSAAWTSLTPQEQSIAVPLLRHITDLVRGLGLTHTQLPPMDLGVLLTQSLSTRPPGLGGHTQDHRAVHGEHPDGNDLVARVQRRLAGVERKR